MLPFADGELTDGGNSLGGSGTQDQDDRFLLGHASGPMVVRVMPDGSLGVATIMTATGSFDHRAIDGADGAELMQAFKALVENPLGMLA